MLTIDTTVAGVGLTNGRRYGNHMTSFRAFDEFYNQPAASIQDNG